MTEPAARRGRRPAYSPVRALKDEVEAAMEKVLRGPKVDLLGREVEFENVALGLAATAAAYALAVYPEDFVARMLDSDVWTRFKDRYPPPYNTWDLVMLLLTAARTLLYHLPPVVDRATVPMEHRIKAQRLVTQLYQRALAEAHRPHR